MKPTSKLTAPPPRKNGRPTKYSPETVKRVLRCVEKGMPLSLASSAAGVSYTTVSDYRMKYPQFAEALAKAIAKGVEKRLKKIEEASEAGDWRASAWLLEHTRPEHFAKNRIEVTGANGAPLAGAVAVYLPQKDGGSNGHARVLMADAMKEVGNGTEE